MDEALLERQRRRQKRVQAALIASMAVLGGKCTADAAFEKGRTDAMYQRAAEPTPDARARSQMIAEAVALLKGERKESPKPDMVTAGTVKLRKSHE
jgi:hypothetical protein